MRTLEERDGTRTKKDLQSQSPSWNKNGYHPNVSGSQSEIFEEDF